MQEIDKLKTRIIKELELTSLLQNNIDKYQLLYVLSRIRMSIEKNKSDYKELWFYCSWTLHSKLNYKSTTQIISDLFDDSIDSSKSGTEIAKELIHKHSDFFKLKNLKNELTKILKEYNIEFEKNNSKWINIMRLFFELIEDCPVIVTKSSDKIEKLELVKDKNGNYSYKFNLKENKRSPIVKIKFK